MASMFVGESTSQFLNAPNRNTVLEKVDNPWLKLKLDLIRMNWRFLVQILAATYLYAVESLAQHYRDEYRLQILQQ